MAEYVINAQKISNNTKSQIERNVNEMQLFILNTIGF